MTHLGKVLIGVGIIMVVTGSLFLLADKISWFGKLPGDIYIQKKGCGFYFPVTTCILISIIISLILFLLGRK